MQLVLFAGQVLRQKRRHALRAATAKMRNQQKDPGTLSHGPPKGKLSISRIPVCPMRWKSPTRDSAEMVTSSWVLSKLFEKPQGGEALHAGFRSATSRPQFAGSCGGATPHGGGNHKPADLPGTHRSPARSARGRLSGHVGCKSRGTA